MMKHSDYNGLIQALDFLTTGMHGADTLRVLFDKREVEVPAGEPGGPATVDEPTDQAREHPMFKDRRLLLLGASETVDDVAYKMEQFVDGFVEENQARADQGLSITPDGRALFVAMSRFMTATDTPIPGAGNLYDSIHVVTVKTEHDGGVFSRDVYVHGVRSQCREWMDRLIAWFPDLNPDQEPARRNDPPANKIPGNPAFVKPLENSDAYKQAIDNGHITPPNTWNGTIKSLATWLNDSGLLSTPQPFNVTEKTTKWQNANGVFLIKGVPITAKQLKNGFNH